MKTRLSLSLLLLVLLAGAAAADPALLGMTPASSGPIGCGQTTPLTFTYTPAFDSPALRGYTIRVTAAAGVTFTASDIAVNDDLTGEEEVAEILENGANDFTIDYAILGTTAGITVATDLFVITFHGDSPGSEATATISFGACELRDLDNQTIAVDATATADILVDCLAPLVPTMSAEPTYSLGTTNTVAWSDEAASGATEYAAECATDAGFVTVIASSGWIAGLSHEFTGLSDATPYWYRVQARDAFATPSAASAGVSSTQDASPPATSADALAAFQGALTFDVAWTGSDALSGLATVELFYDNGGGWTSYGSFATSPISFTAPADGSYGFYTVGLDAVGNLEDAPVTADALTVVDTTAPAGSLAINGGAASTGSLSVTLNSAVTDATAMEMRFSDDGLSWSAWTAYAATQAWTLPAGPDGPRTVYAEYRDAFLLVLPVSDSIDYDTVGPSAATAVAAAPQHEGVSLSWTDPGDADLAGLEIWRAVWHLDGVGNEQVSAYPEYSELNPSHPTRPASRAAAAASAEWDSIGTALPAAGSFLDAEAMRGVYFYEVFPVDVAGNYAAPAATNDYATNYWLGDVQPAGNGDGLLDLGDISVLGGAYGSTPSNGPFEPTCDVGPTTHPSGSGLGIPAPDDAIGFEDLMIFALNYGNVGPLPIMEGSELALLSWYRSGDGAWSLALNEPCANLKALWLTANLPAGVSAVLTAGGLLGEQDHPVFLKQIAGGQLDVSLALMGRGQVLAGQGVLFTVTLPAGSELGQPTLSVRDAANAELDFTLGATAVGDAPTSYRFVGSFPNPFNPKTTIAFDLPETQFVRLAIFGADGRRVATLLDAQLPAGQQRAVWNGRDDNGAPLASGVYFCRLDAGPLQETRKLMLMK